MANEETPKEPKNIPDDPLKSPPKRIKVFNNTPRRIAIFPKVSIQPESPYLVISPFSTKFLSEKAKEEYDLQRWEQEDLIKVDEYVEKADESQNNLAIAGGCGIWVVIYLMVGLLVPLFRISHITWIIFGIIFLIFLLMITGTGLLPNIRENSKNLGKQALRMINLIILLLVVLGLYALLFYLFSGGEDLVPEKVTSGVKDPVSKSEHDFTLVALGRVIQYLFLVIATLLPALMYFLFNRSKSDTVQENFIREVLHLDPGIRSISEAKSKYLTLVQESFGTSYNSAFLFSSGLPILLCTLLILTGWLLVLQPFEEGVPVDIQQMENLLLPHTNAVTFAFLGSYFFALNLVFRHYIRADLTPKTYTHIILRLLISIILAWTLSALPLFSEKDVSPGQVMTALKDVAREKETTKPSYINMVSDKAITDSQPSPLKLVADTAMTVKKVNNPKKFNTTSAGGLSTGLLFILAFFIGIFPETGMTVIRDLTRNPFFIRLFPRLEEEHPLTRLDGITIFDRSRFIEEGIENIENLAHHNLIGLMLNTRISTNRLVDMFDQAILYLHLGLDPDEIEKVRKQLRIYGIRTATDLEAAYKAAGQHSPEELSKFLMILNENNGQSGSLSRIQTILDTLQDDDWMAYLRNWRELSQQSTKLYTLEGVTMKPLEDEEQKAMAKIS